MARRPRREQSAGIHHVYARGTRAQTVFADDVDRQLYLRLLARQLRMSDWRCLAYCLMGNHLHLLVETVRPDLGAGMRRLHGNYARYFNDRHKLVGHVFQGRYGATRIKDDVHLVTALRYVENNASEAGLADWPWTSAARPAPPWLAVERRRELLRAEPG
jgi:putative transposase